VSDENGDDITIAVVNPRDGLGNPVPVTPMSTIVSSNGSASWSIPFTYQVNISLEVTASDATSTTEYGSTLKFGNDFGGCR